MLLLVELFRDDVVVAGMVNYRMLKRLLSEQCEVKKERV